MKSCLVVDDSLPVRKVARQILENLEFSVEEAADGQCALETCSRAMPDAILLDWHMPVMDGLEFLYALRQRDGGDLPVVVFCTAETDVGYVREAISAGADEYIMKPIDNLTVRSRLVHAGLIDK